MIKSAVKYVVEVFFNLPLLFYKRSSKRKIILMLTPQYLNWGDQAIALSEKQLIKERYPDVEVLEINMSFYQFWNRRVRKIIAPNDYIIITGGGFMGDLWYDGQVVVEHILQTYRENEIMFAPQTIFFQDKAKERHFCELTQRHGKIYALAREENTGKILKDSLNFKAETSCHVVPDMAILLMSQTKDRPREKAALCFRIDHEKIITESEIRFIRSYLREKKISCVGMKMHYMHVEIPTWLRTVFVKWKLKQYTSKKVVITDRLHSMIFAAITATPCIAFDNISGKVRGVYEKWIKDLPYIAVIDDVQKFGQTLEQVCIPRDRQAIMKIWQEKLRTENMDWIWRALDQWNQL